MRRVRTGAIMNGSIHRRNAGWEEEKVAVSSAEENKALVRHLFEEVYNRGKLDVADEVLAPDFAWKLPGKDAGIEVYKQWIASQLAASSDLHFSIEEQVAEGAKVVTRLIGSGTHDQKGFEGFAPSGVRITIEAIIIHRVIEGKIVEERNKADFSPFWQQHLEQERIERERVEQELRLARSIQQASLPKEVPTLEGWQISPITNQRGGRRFLRLPSSLGGPAWSRGRRRHGQGRPSGVGHVHHLRHAASWSPELLCTWADAPTSQ
jgi:predicted ester cyclase